MRAMLLASWLHDIDPFLIRFTPSFGVRWYGLSYVIGFLAAWLILVRMARRGLVLMRPESVPDLIVNIIVGTLVGGRLGYCIFYRPELLWTFDSSPPWWGLLAVNQGGMASHGGMVGIVVACWLFARREKLPMLHAMDCIAFVAPAGIFLGRIANFINGELLGRIVTPPGAPGAGGPWWAVKFPQELLEPGHAPVLNHVQTEKLEAMLGSHALPGDDMEMALERIISAVQHGDRSLAAELAPLISARHPSQLYQAFAEGILVAAALVLVWIRPRRPGVISSWFLIVYGVGRVITEFWRLPDAHLAVQRIAGLSRGQWLSVVMVITGGALLLWVSARQRDRVGGWMVKNEKTQGG